MSLLNRFNTDMSWDVLSTVKDMLLEIGDNNFTTNCVIRRIDGKEFIRIGVSKPVIVVSGGIIPSFTYKDIRESMVTIIDYLEYEGFVCNYNKGTCGYVNSRVNTSRIEMWFENCL